MDSIQRAIAYCASHGVEIYEFCIADNGSTDGTAEIGRALAARHRNVSYRRLPTRGFGLALKSAWGDTDADFVGYMDVDLATDLRHLKEVHDLIHSGADYQLYLGSRWKPDLFVKNRTMLRGFISLLQHSAFSIGGKIF